MALKEQLMADFKEAMKARDEIAKNTINLARAAVKQYEVDNREELDDAGIIAILSKQVKMRKDALADFEKAGRTDLVEAYSAEIEILSKYLPEQLSREKLMEVVQETAAALGIEGGKQNMGKLMGPVMGKVKGLADGNMVKEVVMEFLAYVQSLNGQPGVTARLFLSFLTGEEKVEEWKKWYYDGSRIEKGIFYV